MFEKKKNETRRQVLIFGGTTEGRLLAKYCSQNRIPAFICVASDYGRELVPESPWLTVRTGALGAEEMAHFMSEQKIRLVVDATHPYASAVTANIESACRESGTEYLRCIRESVELKRSIDSLQTPGAPEAAVWVNTAKEAAAYLEEHSGNVLLTTGSKELPAFAELPGFNERVYARVLPSVPSVTACEQAGLKGRHIICMQGPFSVELNEVLIREFHISCLVTKEAGKAGGFEEKLQAAIRCGITAVIIGRPSREEGFSRQEICLRLDAYAADPMAAQPVNGSSVSVVLAGIGTGAADQMTQEVVQVIREGEALIGAPRVLKSVSDALDGLTAEQVPLFLASDVMRFLGETKAKKVVALFSGDTGFYSGAKALAEALTEKDIPFSILPGLSSVSYFASRLGVSWEDALLRTAHGREFDPLTAFETGARRIFLLTGGANGAGIICQKLCSQGLTWVQVTVGERLSYPEEEIISGTAGELCNREFDALSVMLIEKEDGKG